MKKNVLVVFMLVALLFSCQEEALVTMPTPNNVTRAIVPETFDWDTADFMPTPPSQSIPVPWIGQGSIAMYYGLDVVNDHKHKDGWELMYSSFRSSGPVLNDPYFILYNKYRGLLQLYVYITNPTVIASNNVLSEISLLGDAKTTMFNYLGNTIVDAESEFNSYDQILPSMGQKGVQFAPNKWYMIQYELAYDPYIQSVAYNDVHLDFNLQFTKVETLSIDGKQTGVIEGTIGSEGGGILSKISNVGKGALQAVIGFVGKSAALNLTKDEATGGNKLGIKGSLWKNILSGVSSVLTGGTSNTLKSVAGVLSAVIFGSSDSTQAVNLKFNTTLDLSGKMEAIGSFPSMPIDLWVPGTNIPINAQQYIPLYNKVLGVFNVDRRPQVTIIHQDDIYEGIDDSRFEPVWARQIYTKEYLMDSKDLDRDLMINPEVEKIADVDVDYDVLYREKNGDIYNETEFTAYDSTIPGDFTYGNIPIYDVLVRYRVKVTPHDKSINPSLIVKTFLADKTVRNIVNRHSM